MEAVIMNFNIYLDDETGQQLNEVAKKLAKAGMRWFARQ
jgi:hypothetical protein